VKIPMERPTKHYFVCYVYMHFKTILWRKKTNGFGDKVVLALQAQCASITSVEQNTIHCDFTGMKIT
jgi:hypothetical protein